MALHATPILLLAIRSRAGNECCSPDLLLILKVFIHGFPRIWERPCGYWIEDFLTGFLVDGSGGRCWNRSERVVREGGAHKGGVSMIW